MNKVIVFDMDGTLFDTQRANFCAYTEAVKIILGNCSISEDIFNNQCFGKNYKYFLSEVFGIENEYIEKIHQKKNSIYMEYVKEYAKVNEFLFRLIDSLSQTDKIVLYTTASKKNTYEILDYFCKRQKFDFIITAEDVKKLKPCDDGFNKIFEKYNISSKDMVYFDDSKICIDKAIELGIEAYWVNWSCR